MARRLTRLARLARRQRRVGPRVARLYRYGWWVCWAPLAASATVVGLVLGSLFDAVALGGFAAIFAALVTALFREHAPATPASGSSSRIVRFLSATPSGWAATWAGVGAAVLTATEAALGAAVWPLALAAVLTSPRALSAGMAHLRRVVGAGRCTRAGGCTCGCREAVRAEDLAGLVRGLSNAELCLAWCESWAQLHCARTPEVTHGVVVVREAYLAEFERRDPHATRAWLTTLAETSLTDPEQWLPRIAEDGAT